jgi:hypothetical protein
MKENLYVEYKKWIFFWGLMLDSEQEINSLLKKYNDEGWNCIHTITAMPNLSISMKIIIIFINLITLGFVSYWAGATFLFERDKDGKSVYDEVLKTNAMLGETLGSISLNIDRLASNK